MGIVQVRDVRRLSFHLKVLFAFVVAAGIMGLVGWRLQQGGFIGWGVLQDADEPLGMPADGEVDHRFDELSPWQTALIPRALRFDPPLGSDHGGLIYNAQKFWEMNEKRGGYHVGDDLNGIGGMNTDLGDPVFAVADGLVLYAAQPSPGWGQVLVIAHMTPDGSTLHSMFAHLDRIDVVPGALVVRGGKVGTVGTANGYYMAHLHFEIRASDGVDIGGGYAMEARNRRDPSASVALLRHAAPDDLARSPLAGVLAGGPAPWISNASKEDGKASDMSPRPAR